jgi:NAD(P)-dependent dehydrogenase (short-subunit alcohol dehydrogenase family)
VLDAVAEEVEKAGRRALAVPTDLTEDDAVTALARAATERFGRVDAVVHNAFAGPAMADLTTLEPAAISASFDTDVFGALRLTRAFAPALTEAGGAIVMINSAVLRHSRPLFGPYRMSKSGLLALARSLAAELGPDGVRVNTVMPNYVWAEALQGYYRHLAAQRGVPVEQVYAETAAATDLRRLPEPDEVANAVVFLASDLASAITGQCLDVNCGEFHH